MIGALHNALGSISNHFDGDVDEVEFFKRALTEAELLEIFKIGPSASASDEEVASSLIGFYLRL